MKIKNKDMNELLKWLAAYDLIPLGLSASNLTPEYEYIFDILFHPMEIQSMAPFSIGGLIYTRIVFNDTHPYKTGETIFLDDANNWGRYNIFRVDTTTSIVIDYREPKTLVGTPKVYRNVPYNMPPNLEGKAEVNLSPVLRTFVTENLVATQSIYSGDKTRFCYDLNVAESKLYEFNFTDNFFVDGKAGFIWEGQLTQPPFQAGDLINIQQEQYEWVTTWVDFYVDVMTGVIPRLTLLNPSPFTNINSQLLINGTPYDGFTTLDKILTTPDRLVTTTPTALPLGNTGSVSVFGHVKPEYNTTTSVIGLTQSNNGSWIVITDLDWAGNTPTIGGTIVKANGQREITWNIARQSEKCVFNARRDHPDWELSYSEYVVGACGLSRKISTILNHKTDWSYSKRRDMTLIDFNAKSDLLVHNETPNASKGLMITGYDKSDNVVFKNFLRNNSGNELDYYAPIGLSDLIISGDLEPQAGFTSLTASQVVPDWYGVCANKVLPQLIGIARAAGNGNIEFIISDTQAAVWFSQDFLQIGQSYTVIIDGIASPTLLEIIDINPDGLGNQIIEFDELYPFTSDNLPASIPEQFCSVSECVAFEVDSCSPYENWNVMFKDARGSWVSYPFKLMSRDELEVERGNFLKGEKIFDVQDFDRGEKSFMTRSRDKVKLTTDWVSDRRNYIIKDLFKSASVYIQEPGGRFYAAMIVETEMEVRKDINEMIHNYELTFRLSRQNWRF